MKRIQIQFLTSLIDQLGIYTRVHKMKYTDAEEKHLINLTTH